MERTLSKLQVKVLAGCIEVSLGGKTAGDLATTFGVGEAEAEKTKLVLMTLAAELNKAAYLDDLNKATHDERVIVTVRNSAAAP